MGEPLARLLVHRGPVRAAAVDQSGRYLVTAGADAQVKACARVAAPALLVAAFIC